MAESKTELQANFELTLLLGGRKLGHLSKYRWSKSHSNAIFTAEHFVGSRHWIGLLEYLSYMER